MSTTPTAVLMGIFLSLLLSAGVAFPPDQDAPKQPLKQEWTAQRAEYWRQIEEVRAQGKLGPAIRVAQQLVDIERRLLGHEHELVVDSLGRLAGLYLEHGDYAAACRVRHEVADRLAARHGPADWRTTNARLDAAHAQRLAELRPEQLRRLGEADRAEQQARQQYDAGQYRQAVVLYEQAITTYQELLGHRNRAVFNRLTDLAGTYRHLGELDCAETLNQLALCFCWQTVGAAHPASATILNNLGLLYAERADYGRAEQLYVQALETNRTLFGDDHVAVAGDLNNLGSLYRLLGDYGRAEKAHLQAEAIFRKHLGERHPTYATSLNNLASVYMDGGNYDRAEQLYRQALAVRRQVLPGKHPDCAASLNNLGALYHTVNDYAQALALYREAAAIIQQTMGEEHVTYAITLDNMAQVCVDAGWHNQAEELALKALAVKKKACGERHPIYLDTLHNLAAFYLQRRQDPARAEPLLRQLVALRKELLGERHPDYAASLHYLAGLHRLTGAYDQAETLALRARAIRREVLGPDHPACTYDLALLAEVYAATGRNDLARSTLDQTLALEEKHLERVSSFATEAAMRLHLAKANRSLLLLLSLVGDQAAGDAAARTQALTWVLRRKGAVLNALCRFREVQRVMQDNPDIARQAARVRAAREHVNNLALRPPAGVTAGSFQEELRRLRLDCDRQEADLHRTLVRLRPATDAATAKVDVAAVRRRLGRDAALVEFVAADPCDFRATGKQPLWQPPRYLAFVLTGDPATPPQLIDLGEVGEIDLAVRDLRERLARADRELTVVGEKRLDEEFRTHSAALGRRLFDRLRPALGPATHVYIAPDGELNQLAFELLAGADGHYLAEHFRFNYLSGGRDLLRPRAAPARGTAVLAGPDFDWQGRAAPANALPTARENDADERLVLGSIPMRELRGLRWKTLPAAAGEADDVRGLLQETVYGPVQTWVGRDAREEVLKALRTPRILHLATHGFFLPEKPARPEDLDGAPTPADRQGAGAARGKDRLRGLHSLFRSGFVLAGANWLGEPGASGEDGWVTAEEVARMDLKGTELVVLSACESGLGDVQVGEGVFGLRRAFLYAGADTLVVSLFKVPDTETRALMQAFYQGLGAGKGKLVALQEARQAMIQARRDKYGGAHPLFWAGFVLVGMPD